MDNVVEKAMVLAMAVVVLCLASGHRDWVWVWKGIAYVQHQALTEARAPWGNPSIFQYAHRGKSHHAHPKATQ